ncbi:hypothetical protein SAMD00019534_049970 [Acytostelium subglobosum LB1]|uniref:hypothetical protein n=1 Tax=Acytostelium subglobosum LB1 TaxID=1410327 RepID=UPI0006451D8B|nr:hypothetical protein SAMD00019534_049970 [Acytostelium subglobosum LB1]GAM21822.1 hypothetical protein SAMD00019534_049970 [Acytostelium subglobosum LB1]|eukprot:XP_012754922.1 hypothetical protein SAMD00019534_049970 [Acytostelium subglobosum LB1]
MNELQDLLVVKIGDYLDNDVDRLCFTLMSKRLYRIRNKLTFNCTGCTLDQDDVITLCTLKSYREPIGKSLDLKKSRIRFTRLPLSPVTQQTPSDQQQQQLSSPLPVVFDLLALSSNPAFQQSPSISSNFSESIKSLKTLKKQLNLSRDTSFNRSIIDVLPATPDEEQTSYEVEDSEESLDDIPPSILRLTFGSKFNRFIRPGVLPEHLTHLTFGHRFNRPILPDAFPPTVRVLEFGYRFNSVLPMGAIPPSVTKLSFGHDFNQSLVNLPTGITQLKLDYEYARPLTPGSLPPALIHLRILSGHNFEVAVGSFPNGLQHLEFGVAFDQPLVPGLLPNTITHLLFGQRFNRPIPVDVLPTSLQSLVLGEHFDQPLEDDALPRSLHLLTIECDIVPSSSRIKPIYDHPLPLSSVRHVLNVNIYRHTFRLRDLGQHVLVLSKNFIGGFLDVQHEGDDQLDFRQLAKHILETTTSKSRLARLGSSMIV